MLKVPEDTAVYLWTSPMDMRCGFERLAELIRAKLGKQVIAGGVYVFLSRKRERVKLLWCCRTRRSSNQLSSISHPSKAAAA